ncbi:fanconi-associated nuclease 1 isoform X4 [Narcine bancroftii]|uniref:fanconi-associated nuclease 1 isoform X4 n=1 Tax=Narcine bancroftii TaxID=1343680 RepID=UPI0038311D0D
MPRPERQRRGGRSWLRRPRPGEPAVSGGEAPDAALGAVSGSPPPYYLTNFLTVLDAVLRGPDAELLNQEDGHWIRTFRQLSAAGQKLYVRLFQRKLNWLKVNRLNYMEIASDLGPIVDELALAGLVQTGAELHDISDAVDLLSAPELKLLAKHFHLQHQGLRYEAACHTLTEVGTAMANKAWEDALHICKAARKTWNCVENSSDIRFFQELPVYLRCFTAGWVYTRIRFRGVEILQRLHMYKEAAEELKSLLDQNVFCPDSRGHWWDRLTMNLHQHLKQVDQAIHSLREGMADIHVHAGHRLALQQRAQRIRDSPSCKKWHHLLQELPKIQVEDVPHVTIKGRSCPGMGNALFLMQEESHSTVICSVEAVSLAHYQQQGFDQGIHGEGATFLTLFGLLFWEIIFLPGIPDVFRNPFQTYPLDLYTDDFYQHRREPIGSRLRFLQDASTETLHALIANVWNNHKGTSAALVNWEIFSSLQQAQSLVSCLGGLFLSGICKILAEDLRHCHGGLPDLVVWNSKSLQYKLAEVKGPTDHLSHKQTIWLDQLQKLGASVEVCHVSAVGGRGQQLS